MKTPVILFCIAFLLPFTAVACPMGMQEHGDICVVPAYSMDDYIRERHEAINSIGDNPYGLPKNYDSRPRTPEELRAITEAFKVRDAEKAQKEKRDLAIAKGEWHVDSKTTPEGNLCIAVFSKYSSEDGGKDGGIVSIMGFQNPKPDAWMIFYGTGLPKPRDVKKLKIALQQDDEPSQTVQAFNYKLSKQIGAVAFAVPGLTAALDGMRDKQSFKLSLAGKTLMTIQWDNGAAVIQQLKQCAR